VLYEAIRTGWYSPGGFEINKLARHDAAPTLIGGHTTYPAMTKFRRPRDNADHVRLVSGFRRGAEQPNLLIAPDVINQKMMRFGYGRRDMAGDTGPDRLRDRMAAGCCSNVSIFPQVSAVSFPPDNSNLVAIGTRQTASSCFGRWWSHLEKVPGSEVATLITSLTWRKRHRSDTFPTYGRGLWRLKWELNVHVPDLAASGEWPCDIRALHPNGCSIRPMSRSERPMSCWGGH